MYSDVQMPLVAKRQLHMWWLYFSVGVCFRVPVYLCALAEARGDPGRPNQRDVVDHRDLTNSAHTTSIC